jgi:hypothetical protein
MKVISAAKNASAKDPAERARIAYSLPSECHRE